MKKSKNFRVKKIFLLAACLIVALGSALAAQSFVTRDANAEKKEEGVIKEILTEASILERSANQYKMTNGTMRKAAPTGEEQKEAAGQYIADLEKVYSAEASIVQNEKKKLENEIVQGEAERFSAVIDNGVFDVSIQSKKIEEQTAVVEATLLTWQKYIVQRENGAYRVLFPVNRDKVEVKLVKEGDDWKVASYDILHKDVEGDYDQEESFDSLEEAIAYADKTTPNNVF
ncbi:MAG: hypothetical protein HFE78_00630 [Clostridiales bacterium]|nr:hypothetical protein [Clostridiales bacterium]